jgi:hypothetical protein
MRFSMRLLSGACALAVATSLTGCVTPPPAKDYTVLNAAKPRSILVVPVVNNSTQVDAADNFLATLAPPLGERGYYVFPVNLVQHVMDNSGLGDASLVASANPTRVASLFGADTVLYATVEKWSTEYILFSSSTTVQIHYSLKSGKNGATLWDRDITTVYQPQGASGGNPLAALIADAIVAAIVRAHPNYIPLANQANVQAFDTTNEGLPYGPYDSRHGGF